MSCRILSSLFFFFFFFFFFFSFSQAAFHEHGFVKMVDEDKYYVHFQFDNKVLLQDGHYGLFPSELGSVMKQSETSEIHLTFTRSPWQQHNWGFPVTSQPLGAHLHAWFNPLPQSDVDLRWKGLVHTLGGIFCGSLNFIDQTITSDPINFFKKERDDENFDNQTLRYGSLPHETVCTENITPWIKLLPCKDKVGLGSLLSPTKILDSHFFSMAIHVYRNCLDEECSEVELELKQAISIVFHLQGFSFQSAFGKSLNSQCPLSQHSEMRVFHPRKEISLELQPSPSYQEFTIQRTEISVYDLKLVRNFNLIIRPEIGKHFEHTKSWLQVQRKVIGGTDERGKFITMVNNLHPDKTLALDYFDYFPWFLRIYLHSIQLIVNEKLVSDNVLTRIQPSNLRSRPTVIQLAFQLPPNSTSSISFDFEKIFLKIDEHLPDANRGFDISGGMVSFEIEPEDDEDFIFGGLDFIDYLSKKGGVVVVEEEGRGNKKQSIPTNHKQEQKQRIRVSSNPLLIPMPTPDFSMPYNVITLTCTLLALFFGSIFNTSIRSFHVVRNIKDPHGNKSFKQRLLAKIWG